MAREILADLRCHFADKMFKTIICFNTKIKEASSFGQPVSEYDPASKGHKDFHSLTQEVLGAQPKQQRHDFVNTLADQLESISATADELLHKSALPVEVEELPDSRVPLPDDDFDIDEFITSETDQGKHDIIAIEKPKRFDTDTKLSDYYGVNQIDDAVVFVTLYPRAADVHIAGDFNNWQPEQTPMQKVGESGVWQTEMDLSPGRYRYRLVVDGQWQQDPYNEATESNPFGGFNSVIEVK